MYCTSDIILHIEMSIVNLKTIFVKKQKQARERPTQGRGATFRPRPHVSGDFCIRKFFYADTPSVHTCPPYTLGVSGDLCIRSPEWKFLYTLCIRIRVDARIRIFLYTLTSQYQNQAQLSL